MRRRDRERNKWREKVNSTEDLLIWKEKEEKESHSGRVRHKQVLIQRRKQNSNTVK